MKEKTTEDILKHYVYTRGGWGQKVQSGALMVMGTVWDQAKKRKVQKPYKITLADQWTPDMVFCIPTEITQEMVGTTMGIFLGVEVKKSAVEVNKWLKLKERVYGGEKLPVSYDREEKQIMQARRITKAGGFHYITHSLAEFIGDLAQKFPKLK